MEVEIVKSILVCPSAYYQYKITNDGGEGVTIEYLERETIEDSFIVVDKIMVPKKEDAKALLNAVNEIVTKQ